MQSRYVLGTDEAAASRLAVLDAVYGETSRSLIKEALPSGTASLSFADVGCGTGLVTLAMANAFAKLAGIDEADYFVHTAAANANKLKLANVEFTRGNASAPPLPTETFDCVYSRCLLSHLTNPLETLKAMIALARPGGVICVEDIDCGGVFAHPEIPDLMRHAELYQKIIRRSGGDPLLGRKLPRLFRQAGLNPLSRRVVSPTEPVREIKKLYALTIASLEEPLVEAGLSTSDEVKSLTRHLEDLTVDSNARMAATPMVQVWARKV